MQLEPLYSGHTGFGSTSLALIALTQDLIEEVVAFRPTIRDFAAPRMELASPTPNVPLADWPPQEIDVTA